MKFLNMITHVNIYILIVLVLCSHAGAADDRIKIQEPFNNPSSITEIDDPYNEFSLVREESAMSQIENGTSLQIADLNQKVPTRLIWDLDLALEGRVLISFDYLNKVPAGTNQTIMLRDGRKQGIQLTLSSGQGGLSYHDGSKHTGLGVKMKAGQWYRVAIVLPSPGSPNQTFELMIRDAKGARVFHQADLKFREQIRAYRSLWFTFNVGPERKGSKYLIDNLAVVQE